MRPAGYSFGPLARPRRGVSSEIRTRLNELPLSAHTEREGTLNMYTLKLDVPVTRRKTLNHVIAQDGELVYSDRRAGECIKWLYEIDEMCFWLQPYNVDDDQAFECNISLLPWISKKKAANQNG